MINTSPPATPLANPGGLQPGLDITTALANRLGAHKGLNLSERKRPNVEETTAAIIWKKENGQSSIIYDPWCTNKMAQVIHGHYHTSWARNVHFAWRDGLFKEPALFDWKDKAIYIVGRGASVKKNLEVLNSVERKNPAIFVSSAYVTDTPQPHDFVMVADNRILVPGHSDYRGAINNPLISFPGIDREIVGDNWNGLYGFNPWTRSPLNDWMRELFPHLPMALDILCTTVMATHLACLNGAKAVIFVGMDNTITGDHKDKMEVKDIHGKECRTQQGYMEMQTAVAQFAGFARFHCKTKFINATGAGVFGVNYFAGENEKKLFAWIEQTTVEKVIEDFE